MPIGNDRIGACKVVKKVFNLNKLTENKAKECRQWYWLWYYYHPQQSSTIGLELNISYVLVMNEGTATFPSFEMTALMSNLFSRRSPYRFRRRDQPLRKLRFLFFPFSFFVFVSFFVSFLISFFGSLCPTSSSRRVYTQAVVILNVMHTVSRSRACL